MRQILPFIIVGLATGSVYGLAAVGLVLTYKTSGIFNFAHGAIGTVSVFIYYYLHVEHHLAWPIAAILAVFVVGPLLGLFFERIARTLADVSPVLKITSMVGVILVVIAVGNIWYGNVTSFFPPFLTTNTFKVFGVHVGWSQVIVFLIALICTAAISVFLRNTKLGTSMRGVVDDAALLSMSGTSPTRVRQYAWIIGATFASLSGLLLAPTLSINGFILTLLVIQAFGAAAIGFFSSLPLTYVGGLVVGVAAALATKFVGNNQALTNLPIGLPFLVLFIVLLVTPRGKLVDRRYVSLRSVFSEWHPPWRIRLITGAVAVVLLALAPAIAGPKLPLFTEAVIDLILFVSLGVLVRTSGQVSLCQYGFAAIGASTMGHFSSQDGIPWLAAIILAALTAVPIGALIAIPAIRLSGVFLALATFGFGIVLEQVFYTTGWMFGPSSSGIPATRPHLSVLGLNLASDRGYYYVCLAIAVICVGLIVLALGGRLGRILRGLCDSPIGLETYGLTVNAVRILVFCVSAFLAAIAGALTGSLFQYSTGATFPSFASLTLVVLITIVLFGLPWYALVASISLVIFPAYFTFSGNVQNYLNILFGVSAIMSPVVIMRYKGAPTAVRAFAQKVDEAIPRLGGDREPSALLPDGEGPSTVQRPATKVDAGDRPGLDLRALTVRYGGTIAVDQLQLIAPLGEITGLIGPNGAGKTTTFNACSGLVKPSQGTIFLHGQDVSHLGPAARARRGLGRTFQRPELFNRLSGRENVWLAGESPLAGGSFWRQVIPRRGDAETVGGAVSRAVGMTRTEELLERQARDLSTGQRRLLEITRALTGPFDMLLLDEPSAGLDRNEAHRVGEILLQAVADTGIGVLLVEHDMALVQQVCSRVYVLDFGTLIFQGSVAEMQASPVVRSAYLGTELATDANPSAGASR